MPHTPASDETARQAVTAHTRAAVDGRAAGRRGLVSRGRPTGATQEVARGSAGIGRRWGHRRPRRSGSNVTSRRLAGALALLLVLTALVEIPNQPAANAALSGLTNFEIDANQVVNGPTPPSGGAGVDWANASLFLQDASQPTEPCTGVDPTRVIGKLN